jgi:recombination protein RecA
MMIGRPGLPAGRVIESYGLESHGKSTFAIHMMAQCQKIGGVVSLANTEADYEKKRARDVFGVDPKTVIDLYPDNLEEVLEMSEDVAVTLRRQNPFPTPILLVWDSVAQTEASAEGAAAYSAEFMGLHARILSKGMRKIRRTLAKTQVTFFCVNQLKGTMTPYGEQFATFGGKALKFAASIRIKTKRKEKLFGKEEEGGPDKIPLGILMEFMAEKNKVGVPFKTTDVELSFRNGFNVYRDLYKGAFQLGKITLANQKPGNAKWLGLKKEMTFKAKEWQEFVDEKLGGFDKVYALLTKRAIIQKVMEPYGREGE